MLHFLLSIRCKSSASCPRKRRSCRRASTVLDLPLKKNAYFAIKFACRDGTYFKKPPKAALEVCSEAFLKEERRKARRKLRCKEFKAHVHAAGLKATFISLLPKEMEELMSRMRILLSSPPLRPLRTRHDRQSRCCTPPHPALHAHTPNIKIVGKQPIACRK
jgi:hypothetical protein